jgi:hypothetical protein
MARAVALDLEEAKALLDAAGVVNLFSHTPTSENLLRILQ